MQSTSRFARLFENDARFLATALRARAVLLVVPIAVSLAVLAISAIGMASTAAAATAVAGTSSGAARWMVDGAVEAPHAMMTMSLDQWLTFQLTQSTDRMLANISPTGTARGVVVASPEQHSPNYYYHWIRDAALTMNTVVDLYLRAPARVRDGLRDRVIEYARFSRRNQMTATIAGMGEPKFNVDGSAFTEGWCRPQNDGPALRAFTLTRFANALLDQGDGGYVHDELYDGMIPTSTVIKADLEFVSHHWRETSCDIWEEVSGDHFYTRLVQRRALLEGAALASRLGDGGAAAWYLSQAAEIATVALQHWDAARGVFIPTVNEQGGINYKSSGLDGQVILGILHSGAFAFSDARVQSTMATIARTFESLYPINNAQGSPGIGIGRYPEDVYDGAFFKGGNPWILITAAFANGHYRAASELAAQGKYADARLQFDEGDQYLRRVQYHANPDGSLSEQFDRYSGYMTSARDLTWSHVEVIQAAWARTAAARKLR